MKQTRENAEAAREVFVTGAGKVVLAALEKERDEVVARLLYASPDDADALRGEARAFDRVVKFINTALNTD